MPKFKRGETVTVWMGFTAEGTFEGKRGDTYLIYVNDSTCGEGIFTFKKWDEENKRFTV